jgi:hypothetical protein
MELMSWGTALRCLHCNSQLPLIRKLTDGQFCSAQHRREYWENQQKLGMERLLETEKFPVYPAPQPAAVAVETMVAPAEELVSESAQLKEEASWLEEAPAPAIDSAENTAFENLALLAENLSQPEEPVVEPAALESVEPSLEELAVAPTELAPVVAEPESQPETSVATAALDVAPAAAVIEQGPATLEIESPATNDEAPSLAGAITARFSVFIDRTDDTLCIVAADPVEYEPPSDPYLPDGPQDLLETGTFHVPPAGKLSFLPQPFSLALKRTAQPIEPKINAGAYIRPRRIGLATWLPAGALVPVHFAVSPAVDRIAPRHAEEESGEIASAVPAPSLSIAALAPVPPPYLAGAVPEAAGLLPLPQFQVFEGRLSPHETKADPFDPKLRVRLPKPGNTLLSIPGGLCPLPSFHPVYARTRTAGAVLQLAGFPLVLERPQIETAEPNPRLAETLALPVSTIAKEGKHQIQNPPFLGLAWPVEIPPIQPRLRLVPEGVQNVVLPFEQPANHQSFVSVSVPPPTTIKPWTPVVLFWQRAPRDLKVLAIALPLLVSLAVTPSLPKVTVKSPVNVPTPEAAAGGVGKMMDVSLTNVKQGLAQRAAVDHHDDFRMGLDDWESKADLAETWAFDQAGFVRPGPLAIYRPTQGLSDYTFEFLGQLDRKALSWVFRAQDFNNYHAQRLLITRGGPLPTVVLQTWSVIDGKPGPKRETVLPFVSQRDMLYRIRLEAKGDDFALSIQGHLVDFWSDGRLKAGGVGLFANRGQESRVRWVSVSHQYDALGRVCAYLAPVGGQSTNGSEQP